MGDADPSRQSCMQRPVPMGPLWVSLAPRTLVSPVDKVSMVILALPLLQALRRGLIWGILQSLIGQKAHNWLQYIAQHALPQFSCILKISLRKLNNSYMFTLKITKKKHTNKQRKGHKREGIKERRHLTSWHSLL